MSFLDKLLGREKKTAGDATGDSSIASEGMHQEQEAMASDHAGQAQEVAQDAQGQAAEHQAEHSDGA